MAKKARVVLDRAIVQDWQKSNKASEDDKQVKSGRSETRKRKVVKRLSKPSVAKDPKEKLIEDLMDHLGIARDREAVQ